LLGYKWGIFKFNYKSNNYLFETFKRTMAWMIGMDFTQQRAFEVAEAYRYLYNIRDTQNYLVLKEQLNHTLMHARCSQGSILHRVIRETLVKFE
jgi:hypothetical protein